MLLLRFALCALAGALRCCVLDGVAVGFALLLVCREQNVCGGILFDCLFCLTFLNNRHTVVVHVLLFVLLTSLYAFSYYALYTALL